MAIRYDYVMFQTIAFASRPITISIIAFLMFYVLCLFHINTVSNCRL